MAMNCTIFLKRALFSKSLARNYCQLVSPNNYPNTRVPVSINHSCKNSNFIPSRCVFTYPAPRSLSEIVKLDKLIHEKSEQIENIWISHHDKTDTLLANSINKEEYNKLMERGKKHKFFVVPAFKSNNPTDSINNNNSNNSSNGDIYENILINFQFPQLLFTSLHEYKNKLANAAPYSVLTFYPELVNSHNICLLRIDLMTVNMSKPETRQLYDYVKHFYLTEEGYNYVKTFNDKPNEFNFEEFVQYCKKLNK